MNNLKTLVFNIRLKRAIKKANKLEDLTNCKFMVLLFKGKIKIFRKKDIKRFIAQRKLHGSIQEIEKIALHITK